MGRAKREGEAPARDCQPLPLRHPSPFGLRMARPSFENRERPFVMRALQRRMPCEALAKQGFRMSLTRFAAWQARRMARPSLKTTESALARYGVTAKDGRAPWRARPFSRFAPYSQTPIFDVSQTKVMETQLFREPARLRDAKFSGWPAVRAASRQCGQPSPNLQRRAKGSRVAWLAGHTP